MSSVLSRRLSCKLLVPAVFALSAGCGAGEASDEADHPASGGALTVAGAGGNTAGAGSTSGGRASMTAGATSGGTTSGGATDGSMGGTSSKAVSGAGGALFNGGAGPGGAGDAGSATLAGSSNGGSGTADLPERVVAGYYPNWTESPVRIKDVPTSYNVIYLFAAKPVGGSPGTTGAVEFKNPGDGRGAATNLNADIEHARMTQHRKIILSVGGAGAGMSFPNRQKSQTFVNSVGELYTRLGGFDGLDWNTFEADQAPDTDEMIWISLELKRLHPGFLITAPPAPWNELDQTFCKTMVEAGAMDYVAPQYYDGPNLATQGYITQNVDLWVNLVGERQLVVGFGVWDQANYMAIGDAVATWKQLDQKHPTLRGAFDWSIHLDEGQGWPFANELGPLVVQ